MTYAAIVHRRFMAAIALRQAEEGAFPDPVWEGLRVAADELRDNTFVLRFTHVDHPGCTFAIRMPAVPDDEDGGPGAYVPEEWGDILWFNFAELLEAEDRGLPTDCDPDGLTWLEL
jgi:hypothetical protein